VSEGILIIGATSGMAEAAARLFAADKARLFLIARNAEKLALIAANLRDLGAESVWTESADLTDDSRHGELLEQAQKSLGRIDAALIAHGSLGNQKACEQNYAQTEQELRVNFLSPVSLCTHLANILERQGGGTIAVISSVAGERGRQSNYVYGAAKGGLTRFLEGLRNRLAPKGVAVVSLIPGFVDTPMTANLKKGPLFASAAKAGAIIHRAIQRKRDVVYVPGFWRLIMLIIKSIPEGIFKKLKL
jgi:short-subunit dehydrogenase